MLSDVMTSDILVATVDKKGGHYRRRKYLTTVPYFRSPYIWPQSEITGREDHIAAGLLNATKMHHVHSLVTEIVSYDSSRYNRRLSCNEKTFLFKFLYKTRKILQ